MSLVAYVRVDPAAGFTPQRFGPKQADHPTVHARCPACWTPLKVGDYTTLIPFGPDDTAEYDKAQDGLAFTAMALELHWMCATGRQEE